MAVTATRTANDIVNQACRKAMICAIDENPSNSEAQYARRELDAMLKAWQAQQLLVFTRTAASLALTTAGVYTLDPVRPLRILSARLKRSGIETPMQELTRDEYDELPNKSSTGLPTTFYYDRQREAARFYIWPLLSSASGETIEYTYEREIEDMAALADTMDLPGEWWEAAVYGLAARLYDAIPVHPRPNMLIARAEQSLRNAQAFEYDGSVYFGPRHGR